MCYDLPKLEPSCNVSTINWRKSKYNRTSVKQSPIGPWHDSVTWYKIRNKGRLRWTGTSCIVFKSHCATCSLTCVILYRVTGSCKGTIKRPTFIWLPVAKIPETTVSYTLSWKPLFNGQLLVLPGVIFFCFIPKAPAKRSQHANATLLDATCCARLATLLRHVTTCWVLLTQIWPIFWCPRVVRANMTYPRESSCSILERRIWLVRNNRRHWTRVKRH